MPKIVVNKEKIMNQNPESLAKESQLDFRGSLDQFNPVFNAKNFVFKDQKRALKFFLSFDLTSSSSISFPSSCCIDVTPNAEKPHGLI